MSDEPRDLTRDEIVAWALGTTPVPQQGAARAEPDPRSIDRRHLLRKPEGRGHITRGPRPISRVLPAVPAIANLIQADPARRQEILGLVADLAARLSAPEGRPGPVPLAIPRALVLRILDLEPFLEPAKTYRLPMAGDESVLATGAELLALCRRLLKLLDARDIRSARRALGKLRDVAEGEP